MDRTQQPGSKNVRRGWRRALAVGLVLAGLVGGLTVLPSTPAEANLYPWVRGGSDECGTRIEKNPVRRWGAPAVYWDCTMVDQFQGTTLDATRWTVQTTAASGFRQGGACYRDDGQDVKVQNGLLLLSTRKLASPASCQRPNEQDWSSPITFQTPLTGSTIFTGTKFNQAYGRFEVRAKMPATTDRGLQFAFWLFPVASPHGPWPFSGELDVMEWYSLNPTLGIPTMHYGGSHIDPNHTAFDCQVPAISTEFHTYRVEWTPSSIRFYYDDVLCLENRTWTPYGLAADGTVYPMSRPAPFDHPYQVALTMSPGSDNPSDPAQNNSPVAATDFPGVAQVDYVKVWQ